MKFGSIVIASLFGYTQASIRLTRTDGSITDINLIQTDSQKIEEKRPYFQGYTPEYDKFPGNYQGDKWRDPYERVIPEHLLGETGDTFTKKMIKDYALEVADKQG